MPLGRGIDASVWSSNFVSNEFGSALHISQVTLRFYNSTLFENNSAKSGGAIYLDQNSVIYVGDEALVQFVNNSATLYGGAIYLDLTLCISNGV